ncbi:unnamed protein product, partial [Urochloa humidicola]
NTTASPRPQPQATLPLKKRRPHHHLQCSTLPPPPAIASSYILRLSPDLPHIHTHSPPPRARRLLRPNRKHQARHPTPTSLPAMAPLLLLFILGGLCALFSLTTSSRSTPTANKCGDIKADGNECGGDASGKESSSRGNCSGSDDGEEEKAVRKQPARAADPEAELGIVFSTFDHDGDGFITAIELEESLRRLGIAVVSADEAAAMVARVDANCDGLIDIHEFRELYDSIPKKRKHQHSTAAVAREVPVEGAEADEEEEDAEEAEEEERDLREAFDVFDGNKDGLISAEELGTVLGSLGLRAGAGRPAVAECRDMIRLVDSDGDGMVSFEEFKRMMTVVKA